MEVPSTLAQYEGCPARMLLESLSKTLHAHSTANLCTAQNSSAFNGSDTKTFSDSPWNCSLCGQKGYEIYSQSLLGLWFLFTRADLFRHHSPAIRRKLAKLIKEMEKEKQALFQYRDRYFSMKELGPKVHHRHRFLRPLLPQ